MPRTLKFGDKGEDVKQVQTILAYNGFFTGFAGGNFLNLTRSAVVDFQHSHVGPNGKQLDVDGIVGPATRWALANPSGLAQKTNIEARPISGLTFGRTALLDIAFHEHRSNVREVPDGSNYGDGVSKYLAGVGPAMWCMFFVTWCHKQNRTPLMDQEQAGHCLTMWRMAQQLGFARNKLEYVPIPGDTFIMLYRNRGRLTGSGHTGIVSAVSSDGGRFNAFEGNAANRVKQTLREQEEGSLVGFINHWSESEQPINYTRGIVEGNSENQTT